VKLLTLGFLNGLKSSVYWSSQRKRLNDFSKIRADSFGHLFHWFLIFQEIVAHSRRCFRYRFNIIADLIGQHCPAPQRRLRLFPSCLLTYCPHVVRGFQLSEFYRMVGVSEHSFWAIVHKEMYTFFEQRTLPFAKTAIACDLLPSLLCIRRESSDFISNNGKPRLILLPGRLQ